MERPRNFQSAASRLTQHPAVEPHEGAVAGESVFRTSVNSPVPEATERAALREQVTRFIDLSLDLFVIADFGGFLRRVNPAYETILGYAQSELVGRPWLDLVHPDDRERVLGEVEQPAEPDGELRDFEVRLRCKDGSYRVVLWSARTSLQERLVYAVGKDVTDRRRAEEALRAREEHFRQILDTAHEAFISIDEAGLITAWNPEAEATFGWSASEVIGQPLASTIIPDRYRDAHTNGLARFLATGEGPVLNKRLELPALRRDGHEFPIELTISATRLGGENVFNAFLHDISDRKRLESETTRFMELSLDLLAIGDLNGYFRRVNRAFETLLGYREEELVGQSYVELFHPEDRPSVLAEIERMAAGDGETRDFEARIGCKDGTYRSTLWSAKIRPDEQLIYAVGKDITERKRSERAIREIEVLERSNLQLEQFAYDASHDLGEPLRMISRLAGRLGRMYGDRLDENGRRLIASVVDGAERMQIFITDLLAYSRAARDPLERNFVDCSAVLTDTLGILEESIAEKGASVTFDPLPTLRAQPTMVAEVFQNLLSNALKFSDDSPLRVHVGAEREPGVWKFTVRDNGIGIDDQQADRVFEMFRRLHPQDVYAGSGLGLSICKRIVERHGGLIWVEPAPDRGAVFHFTIPDEPPTQEHSLLKLV